MGNCTAHKGDSLSESWAIQEAVSARGFDWPDITGVFAKVREELGEIEQAWADGDQAHARHELGDLLFAAVNLARFLKADPGDALHMANGKFLRRFAMLEDELNRDGIVMEKSTLEELDVVWNRVKAALLTDANAVKKKGS